MRLTRFLPFLAAAFAPSTQAADFANFGTTLEQAKATGFFTWFHLEQTSADAGVLCFQPSGPKFHDKVKLLMKTDGSTIASMTLLVQRSFINGGESPFARDIAKSFLNTGLSGPDLEQIEDLYHEISAPSGNRPIIMHTDAPRPALPATPTAGYRTFLGERPAWKNKYLSLENQGDWLAISLNP